MFQVQSGRQKRKQQKLRMHSNFFIVVSHSLYTLFDVTRNANEKTKILCGFFYFRESRIKYLNTMVTREKIRRVHEKLKYLLNYI
jgi:hypothetical protein